MTLFLKLKKNISLFQMYFMILLLCVGLAHSLPQGAPTKACQTMLPFHGGGIARQNDPSPYEIYTLRREGGVFVVVKSGLELPFEGFMLQARTPNRELIGSFEPAADDAHTIDCDHPSDSLTHSDTSKKSALQVQWHPNGYEGSVIFK